MLGTVVSAAVLTLPITALAHAQEVTSFFSAADDADMADLLQGVGIPDPKTFLHTFTAAQ